MPKFVVAKLAPGRRILAIMATSALFLGILFPSAQAAAQQSSPPKSDPGQQTSPQDSKPSAQQSDDSQEPAATLKVNVNIVQLFFNVKDKHGALIPNLTKDDFEIYEDGKQQTVKYFTPEANLPLTLGILIDSSGSQLRVLDMEKEVGGAFLKQILTDKDLAFVIDFNVDASLFRTTPATCSACRKRSIP